MDNDLKNKLTRFENPPPPGVWDKIVETLNNDENFANRLYNYSETPPVSNWTSIEKNLITNTETARVIPFSTRFKKPLRYLSAASIIALLAISVTLLLRRTEAGALQPGSTATVPVSTQVTLPQQKQFKKLLTNTASTAVSPVKETVTKKVTLRRRFLNLIQPQELLTTVSVAGKFVPGKVNKEALFNNGSLDNYMVFSDGNGMAMRMPKKLFPLVQCKDGDATCLQRIRALQLKISAGSFATDFSAILELLRQVQ